MELEERGRPDDGATRNKQRSESTPAMAGHNSAAAQRARTLEALRAGPKSTIELRGQFDILSPAPRVLELRERGFAILTNWVQHPTACGRLHRVAHYVLLRESADEAGK